MNIEALFHTFLDYLKGLGTDSDGNFRHFGGGINYTWLGR
jgi:hypothetical protein